MNRKDMILYSIVLIIVILLKKAYLNEICVQASVASYYTIVNFSNNSIFNLIWITPIVLNILIISKNIYYELINFDTRYKNRKRYFIKKIKKNFFVHILICIITILIQWFTFKFIFNLPIDINLVSLNILLKYIFEIYFIIIIILLFALMFDNYTYSFIYTIALMFLLVATTKNFYIPFVTLFSNYRINLINCLFLIILYLIIKRLYNRIDLGGVKIETNY